MTLRRATARDASPVALVVEQAYARYVPRVGRRPAPMDQDYREVLAASDTWVVEHDDSLVAVVVTRVQPDHLLLENLAVAPSAQGRGIGGRLLDIAEQHARDNGLAEVRLYTNEAMTENLAFYPRHGYVEVGRGRADGFDRVYFTKTLPGVCGEA